MSMFSLADPGLRLLNWVNWKLIIETYIDQLYYLNLLNILKNKSFFGDTNQKL